MAEQRSKTGVGLLIVDMINSLDFDGAERLIPKLDGVTSTILKLRAQADALGVPVVYVNDNYGHWQSEKAELIRMCARKPEARALIERIAPRDRDYFLLKPRLSGFYATNLPVLLPILRVSRLVLTGVAADVCVLFTAADAHMREYAIWTPRDATASEADERTDWALEIMRNSMSVETRSTAELSLRSWAYSGG